ncbi:hypothetical protein ASE01_02160 [Nocardioides sp. Root190]|nr:hypothetical protein ASE01_02160 [Nocardioides sp. Root190]
MRAEYPRLGPVGRVRLWVRGFVQSLLNMGEWGELDDPRRFCDVILLSRSDGAPLVVFRYRTLGAATRHAHDLARRLDATDVEAFCAELELDPQVARGPGVEPEGPSVVDWVAIAREERRTSWPSGVVVVPE